MYEIGQKVWWATTNREPDFVTCPDCGGTGRIRVIFHDETTVSIDCRNCSVGFDPPKGTIQVYNRTANSTLVLITGLEIKSDHSVEYRTNQSYIIKEKYLFDNQKDANICAKELAEKEDQREREKINNKEKDTRSWAWNASYHKGEIKRMKREIERHEAKLSVAALKAGK